MPDEPKEPTFWQASWTWVKRVVRWIAAPLPAILLVVGAIILIILGAKNVQVGGLLDKLLGRDRKSTKAVDTANSIPEGRVDKDGNLIPLGQPDSKGETQAVVVPITPPSIFSNPDHVEIVPPGQTNPISVQLPDGVKAKDVDKVVIVKPEVYAVVVKDESGITASKVDDLLAKYGGT
jgi:hypothetical protein